MKITTLKTRLVQPPKDDISDILRQVAEELSKVNEPTVVCISAKVVAISQGQTFSAEQDKDSQAIAQATAYLPREQNQYKSLLTIHNGTLIAAAGIDESNSGEFMTKLPENPMQTAFEIRQKLLNLLGDGQLDLAVLIVDSRSSPLRLGTTGWAVGWAGLAPLKNYVGQEDLFGRELKFSWSNIVDGLASSAVLAMGEGSESTPISLVQELPKNIELIDVSEPQKMSDLVVEPQKDLYHQLFSEQIWRF